MTWTILLLRWTARILLTSIDEAVDWADVDVAARFDHERLAAAIDWDEVDLLEHAGPDRLAEAIDWSVRDALQEHVDDELLAAAIVDELDHLPAPVDVVRQLEDDPDRIYVWLVETETAEAQIERQIRHEYRASFGHEPKAAHFVVSDLDRLREFDPDELAYYVDPSRVGGEV